MDPTFLLEGNQWRHFGTKYSLHDFNLDKPYVLCYFIAEKEDYWIKVSNIMKSYQMSRVVVLPMHPSHFRTNFEIIEDAGIEDFIHLINHATLICTDSFHATALSINLNKNFITLLRFNCEQKDSQNSRLEDLLSHYDLSTQIYTDEVPNLHIDYSSINSIMDDDRADSINYVRDIINNC